MMAKSGGLFKLDAICDKLKTNLKTKQITNYCNDSAKHVQQNGISVHIADHGDKDEPNNNTGAIDVLKEINISLTNQETRALEKSNDVSKTSDCACDVKDNEHCKKSVLAESRKSRRKSQNPRNISILAVEQTKDELADYEVNNPGVDFGSICEATMEDDNVDDDEDDDNHGGINSGEWDDSLQIRGQDENAVLSDSDVSRLSCDTAKRLCSVYDESASEQNDICGDKAAEGDFGVLDLSMAHNAVSAPTQANATELCTDEKWYDNKTLDENGVLNLSLGSRNMQSKLVPVKSECGLNDSREEVEMKDYAENTMNELLSMYGLADDGSTDTARIHLKNFDSETFFRKRHLNNIDVSRDRVLFDEPSEKKIKVESLEADAKMNHSAGKSVSERFTTSGCYIKSCLSDDLQPDKHSDLSVSPNNQSALPDYQKYLKRFNSYEECHGNHCEDMAYKEHFHCLDCSFRVFVKKEEMIRHFKWHKKRDESLQHGFMRYSPMDDCSKKFPGNCTHNGKQTHYHCLQAGCSKVYISTSDVQMHANYHRKDSAILQEGFQRFRATEDCATPSCSFYNQRTTHFHCRRLGCTFTFKNKADMEKHKTYHQKDEILTKDGFKKFMKYEHCSFVGCRYSKTSNHIHCIRPGCHYVLHSTGQLYSHKRRHERANYDSAYRRFKISQNKTQSLTVTHQQALPVSTTAMVETNFIKKESADVSDFQSASNATNVNVLEKSATATLEMSPDSQNINATSLPHTPGDPKPGMTNLATIKFERVDSSPEHKVPPSTIAKLVSKLNSHPLNDSLTLPIPGQSDVAINTSLTPSQVGVVTSPTPGSLLSGIHGTAVRTASPTTAVGPGGFIPKVSPPVNEKKERDESWKKFLTRYTANDPCHSRCQFLYKDHYHCNTVNCGMLFRSKDRVREHAKLHEQQERITSLTFMVYEENVSCSDDCQYNQKEKHYHCLWADCKHVISAASDPVFSRMEHYKLHEYSRASQGRRLSGSSPIIGTPPSLKRRRGRPPKYQRKEITQVPKIEMTDEQIMAEAQLHGPNHCISNGFKKFTPSDPCPDDKCIFVMKEHYHCMRQRCHHATDNTDLLSLHAKDFHSYIHILEGFEFFDRTVNCRRPHCHNNKATRHFHCIRPNCDYSFVRVSTMAQHDKKHRMVDMGLTCSRTVTVPTMALFSDKVVPLMQVQVTQPQQMVSIAPGNMARATNTYLAKTTASNACSLSTGLVQVTQTAPIMVAMPPRHPQSSQRVTTSNIQPIIIAPMTTTLQGGSMTKLIPTHHGSVINASSTTPLLIKPPAISTELLPVTKDLPAMTNTIIKPTDNNMAFTSQLITIAPKPETNCRMVNTEGQLPASVTNNQPGLTVLLQQKLPKLMPQTSWGNLLLKMHCSPNQNCGRPFCKLKKKEHFHCFDCNQAFSDPLRLKTHVTKHGFHVDKADMLQGRVIPLSDHLSSVPSEDVVESSSDGEENSSSLNLVPGAFSNLLSKGLDQESIDNEPGVGVAMDLSVSANQLSSLPQGNTLMQESKPAAVVDPPATTLAEPESSRGELLQSLGLIKRPGEASGNETEVRQSNKKNAPPPKQDNSVNSEVDAVKANSFANKQLKNSSSEVCALDPATECKHSSVTNTCTPTTNNYTVQDNCLMPLSIPPTSSPTPVKNHESGNKGVNSRVGYCQYKYNEDCQFEKCAYRQSQSHYHCSQNNCGQAFCDLSRFTQHSERHRRLLDLMGDEFEAYRASLDCTRADCEFSKKSAHFHCLKCPFICTEPVKVTAHRETHNKPSDASK